MLKFNVPSSNEHLSIWIELSSFDELAIKQQRPTLLTLAQSMAKQPTLEVGGLDPVFIPYADLLTAFPDIDPETTYVTAHVKMDRSYPWPRL